MRKGELWMVREIISGGTVERKKFKVRTDKKRATRKMGNTSTKHKDRNGKEALRQLVRKLNCNFHPGDFFLTLKYDHDGIERVHNNTKEAEKQAKLFIQRLARVYKKMGITLRWIEQTSFIDGDTGEVVRIHHHILVTGAAFKYQENGTWTVGGKTLNEIWGFGTVDWQPIRDEDNHNGIAIYMYRQAHAEANEKRWTCSRNMIEPEIHDHLLASAEAVKKYLNRDGSLKIPRAAENVATDEYDESIGRHYVTYTLAGKEEKRE